MDTRTKDSPARQALLDAAIAIIRTKGYAATTVDELCARAGVTKGAFFHHFASKHELGAASAEQFTAMAPDLFAHAPYVGDPDPRARLLAYVDFRASLLVGEVARYTCLMGTLVQEVHSTHPDIRAACDRGMTDHVAMLARDLEAAKALHAPDASWSAESVAYFMQSVVQGAFIFAKAKQSPDVARQSLAHLRRYLETILNAPNVQAREERP